MSLIKTKYISTKKTSRTQQLFETYIQIKMFGLALFFAFQSNENCKNPSKNRPKDAKNADDDFKDELSRQKTANNRHLVRCRRVPYVATNNENEDSLFVAPRVECPP